MKISKRTLLAAVAAAAFLAASSAAIAELKPTKGPNGEDATPAKELVLTPEQEAKVKEGKFTVALVWHENSEWSNAANQGAKDEFKRLGIEVVAETNAGFDPAKQKNDVETVMAKKPNAIFGEAVDPDTAPEAYRPAKEAGAVMVFVDQPPKGYVQGKDYVTIVSDDLKEMGHHAGDALAAAVGNKGNVAYVYHDANFFVTNQRDGNTKQTILDDHKDVKIVAELGLADPTKAEDVLNALILKHPNLDGIYATWSTPAEAILAALRNAGNTHTKIVTFDLSEPLAVDMAKGGNVAAIVADQPYQIGVTGARAVAMGLLKQVTKPYYAVEALTVTKDTIKHGYEESQHREPPATVMGQ
jgi:ribose transport system substrate-binding protein